MLFEVVNGFGSLLFKAASVKRPRNEGFLVSQKYQSILLFSETCFFLEDSGIRTKMDRGLPQDGFVYHLLEHLSYVGMNG